MVTVNLYIPCNVDFDQLLKGFPIDKLPGVKKDHLAYISHSIAIYKAFHDDDHPLKGRGYVPLSSIILKGKVPSYRENLDYLIAAGVIQCDEHYENGVVCKGYDFTDAYRGQRYKTHTITDFTLERKFIKYQHSNINSKSKKKHNHLERWFKTHKLKIDVTAAHAWVDKFETEEIAKIQQMAYNSEKKGELIFRLIEKCEGYKILVNLLHDGQYYLSVDSTGYRFHSILTRLKKELRQFATYDGKPLVSVDIANSQPYLSLALLNSEFWKSCNNTIEQHNRLAYFYKELYNKLREDKSTYKRTIMFLESSKSLCSKEFSKDTFSKLVTSGQFYEHFMKIFKNELPSDHTEARAKTKKMVMRIMYGNSAIAVNRLPGSPMRLFRREFQLVADIFEFIKSVGHEKLPILLQRIESYLVLDIITQRIAKEKPHLSIFTIHDSIVTVVGQEEYVKQVMEEELKKFIGHIPTLKFEYWQQLPSTNPQ